MKCVDCGNSILGFEDYPDIEDVCDKCLLGRYQNKPEFKKFIQKPIEEISYKEAGEILDKVGMIDFPLDGSLRDAIVIENDD